MTRFPQTGTTHRRWAHAVFFSRWLAAPRHIGAILPSSRFLARAVASQIDLCADDPVVELGGGTGSVTRALLDTGLQSSRLVVVENDRHLCTLLRARFPQLRIVHGDASRLTQLLAPLGIHAASSVVSSLPLRSLPTATRDRIVRESLRLLGASGRFVQYTYGPGSPLAGLDLCGRVAARIWLNLPPAAVWSFGEQ